MCVALQELHNMRTFDKKKLAKFLGSLKTRRDRQRWAKQRHILLREHLHAEGFRLIVPRNHRENVCKDRRQNLITERETGAKINFQVVITVASSDRKNTYV